MHKTGVSMDMNRRKWGDDVAIVNVRQVFDFWKFPKNVDPEMESNETENHKLWGISLKSPCSASDIICCPIVRVKTENGLTSTLESEEIEIGL